jgi:hypothetical protein
MLPGARLAQLSILENKLAMEVQISKVPEVKITEPRQGIDSCSEELCRINSGRNEQITSI